MESMSVQAIAQTASDAVERVIVGKRREVQLIMVALFCQGHVLLEDVPGVGKTVLSKAIARTIGSTFKRIQFTPDLLPSDVTGVSIYNQHSGTFEFRPGPVFGQLVLADEVNRASPKTQSALLEAMEERQVTVDGATHRLPTPFVVIATQNPIEYEGTFPLPEAQLDRFMVRVSLGYPGHANEVELLTRQHSRHPLEALGQALRVEQLIAAQEAIRTVHVRASGGRVHRYAGRGDPATRRYLSRGEPARFAGALQRLPRLGDDPRARLCDSRRRQGAGRADAGASPNRQPVGPHAERGWAHRRR